jgi:hypothetical protein
MVKGGFNCCLCLFCQFDFCIELILIVREVDRRRCCKVMGA